MHGPSPTPLPHALIPSRCCSYEPYFTFVDAVRDLGRMLNERIDSRHDSMEGEEDIDKMRRQMRSLASGESMRSIQTRAHSHQHRQDCMRCLPSLPSSFSHPIACLHTCLYSSLHLLPSLLLHLCPFLPAFLLLQARRTLTARSGSTTA